jgi:predicted RNA binding protein YcfA (HicA-like mRNA interferase family)
MTKLPSVSGERVVRALKRVGFVEHHQKGSHLTMKHPENLGLRIVVPLHKGKTLGKGLLLTIIKESGVSMEEFLEIL